MPIAKRTGRKLREEKRKRKMSKKKVIEMEFTQEQADELNKLVKEIGLDKFPGGYKEFKPCKLKCLFG